MKKIIGMIMCVLLGVCLCFAAAVAAEAPVPQIEINCGNETTYYIGTSFEGHGIFPGMPQSNCYLASVNITNGYECRQQYGGDPVFSVTPDTSVCTLVNESFSDDGISLVLMTLPSQETDVTYTIAVDWGNSHAEETLLVHYVEAPGLPTGIEFGFETPLTVKTGDKITPTAWFTDDWSIPDYPVTSQLDTDDKAYNRDDYGDIYAATPGRYDANLTVRCANILWYEQITLIVTDENGNIPGPELKLRNYNDTINRYLGMTNQDEKDHDIISWNALAALECACCSGD